MSRLQTKCVFASATAHLLLLAVLVVSSAFVKPPPKPDNVKFVRIFDASKITDDETQGGGNPNVPSDVQPAPAPPPQVAPVIPQPTPPIQQEPPIKPPEPEKKQEPPKHEQKKKKTQEPPPEPIKKEAKKPEKTETPKVQRKADSKKVVPKTQLVDHPVETQKPEKPKVQVDLTVKTAKEDPDYQKRKIERERERERAAKEAREREEAQRQADIRAQMEIRDAMQREYKERQQALNGIVGSIENKMSSGVAIEMPQGDGSQAFINYADFIWSKYYQAWVTPDDRDVRNPVKVEIVVARDGRIISANIVKSSGDAALDKSVRQALDRVRSLPAFPQGAKDAERTFKISFNLKSKNQRG